MDDESEKTPAAVDQAPVRKTDWEICQRLETEYAIPHQSIIIERLFAWLEGHLFELAGSQSSSLSFNKNVPKSD